MELKKYEISVQNSEKMIFEFTDLAEQTNGSVLVSQGETKILVTATMGELSRKNYFPLRVDYLEKYYARGEIMGGRYRKREGKPSTEATLTSRIIDRSIRPFFPKDLKNEIQVIITVLSLGKYDPDILAINGTSLALATSDIPWNGPTGAIRITKDSNGQILFNPNFTEIKKEENIFKSVFSGHDDKISMIETESKEIPEEDFLQITEQAILETTIISKKIKEIASEIGKEKLTYQSDKKNIEFLEKIFQETFLEKFKMDFVKDGEFDENLEKEFNLKIKEENFKIKDEEINEFLDKKKKEIFENSVLNNDVRFAKRDFNTVREIKTKAGDFSNIVHGTGLFYRGKTHVMTFLTLGGIEDALMIDQMEIQTEKRFMHHYNFPPFSTGETSRLGSPKRRELGHGTLAEKALNGILPSKLDFPQTIRLVSEVFSSNGSTSMAAVCASSLALRDGGVPIKSHIAGIAIGLVYKSEESYKLLTDIKGIEDYYGHMDFKVAGTTKGINAIQLDLKIDGINLKIIKETIEKAKNARIQILEKMEEEIPKPNELPESVPRSKMIKIPPNKIGLIIGSKGVTIKGIQKDTETKINIEDNGDILVLGNEENIAKAIEKIKVIISRNNSPR